MFSHLVILKEHPFYIYCTDENNAIGVAAIYNEKVVGIVEGKDLIVKQIKQQTTLYIPEIKQLELTSINENKEVFDEEDVAEAKKEIEDELEQSTNK